MSEATSHSPSHSHDGSPLGIVCGAGAIPLTVADAVARRGRRVVLFPLRGWADEVALARYPHHWIAPVQFGRLRRLTRAEGCRDLVFIGSLTRPSIRHLRVDLATLRHLPRIIRRFRGGDDHLLSGLGEFLEEHGYRVLGAHEVAPEILVPSGTLGRLAPTREDLEDIARGFALIAAMGPFDVGQAVVVARGRVLAVEAAEGTDRMLARVAKLRAEGRIGLPRGVGVLVKGPKPGQDRRFDLPSIGLQTVAAATAAGLAGIAVEGHGAITANVQQLVHAADAAGLFLLGARAGGAP